MFFSILYPIFSDIKDEIIYLFLFNVFTVLVTLPGWYLVNLGIRSNYLLPFILGLLLCLPLALCLMALSYTTYDISNHIAIRLSTLFRHIRETWREALVWGLINIGVFVVTFFNFRFYLGFTQAWASVLQLLFLGLFFIWLVLQLIMLPLYPRLRTKKFWEILPRAGALLGRYPGKMLVLVFFVTLFVLLAAWYPFVVLFFLFSLIAIFANRFVDEPFKRELEKRPHK